MTRGEYPRDLDDAPEAKGDDRVDVDDAAAETGEGTGELVEPAWLASLLDEHVRETRRTELAVGPEGGPTHDNRR